MTDPRHALAVTLGGRVFLPAPSPYSAEQREHLVRAMIAADFAKLAAAHAILVAAGIPEAQAAPAVTMQSAAEELLIPVLAGVVVEDGYDWTPARAAEWTQHIASITDPAEQMLARAAMAKVLAEYGDPDTLAGRLMLEASTLL